MHRGFHNYKRLSSSSRSLSPLVLSIALATMFTILLSACGGGEDKKTIITTSQASMQANEQVETTVPGEEEFFLAAEENHVVRVNLNPDDVLRINWYAEERALTGGDSIADVYEVTGKLGITLVVKDPLGEVLYLGEEVDKETVDVTADMSGTHTMTFVNTLTFQGQTVLLDYTANP